MVKEKNSKRPNIASLMGAIVIVDFTYERIKYCKSGTSNCTVKSWDKRKAVSRPGWIIGERWLQTGSSYWAAYSYEDETPPEWHEEGKRTHCLLVTYWPTMKPVKVPLDGYRLAPAYMRPYAPVNRWPLSCRKELAKEMAEWPRDSKGRWTKKTNKKGVK